MEKEIIKPARKGPSRLRVAILFVMVIFMFQTPPVVRSAQACGSLVDPLQAAGRLIWSIWEWVKNAAINGQLEVQTQMVKDTYKSMKEKFEIWNSKISESGLIQNAADRMQIDITARLHKGEQDAKYVTTLIGTQARYMMDTNKINTHFPCKSIVTARGVAMSMPSYEERARALFDALQAQKRCPGCTELDYMLDVNMQNIKRGYARAIDGFVEDTSKTDIKGTDGRKIRDADLLAPSEDLTLEMPTFTKREYTDPTSGKSMNIMVAETDNMGDMEHLFMGQWNRLSEAMGNHFVPRGGEMMNTEIGIFQRRAANHCMALEGALIKGCTDFASLITRPSNKAKDDETTALKEAQTMLCDAVREVVDLTPYDDCNKVLSPREEEKIAHEFCQSKAYSIAASIGGARTGELTKGVEKCVEAFSSWKNLMVKRRNLCTKGMAALEASRRCWAEAGRIGDSLASQASAQGQQVGTSKPVQQVSDKNENAPLTQGEKKTRNWKSSEQDLLLTRGGPAAPQRTEH